MKNLSVATSQHQRWVLAGSSCVFPSGVGFSSCLPLTQPHAGWRFFKFKLLLDVIVNECVWCLEIYWHPIQDIFQPHTQCS